MKANEAPEKIYVDSKAIGDNISTTVHTKPQDYPTCTEYTRTDSFIEKAVQWLEEQKEMIGISFQEDFIERFKTYMKEE